MDRKSIFSSSLKLSSGELSTKNSLTFSSVLRKLFIAFRTCSFFVAIKNDRAVKVGHSNLPNLFVIPCQKPRRQYLRLVRCGLAKRG